MLNISTPTQLYSESEAAHILRMHPITIARLRKNREIHAERIGLRVFVYRREELDRFSAGRETKAANQEGGAN